MVERRIASDGTVELTSGGCTYTYRRPRPGVILVAVTGDDRGDLGPAPLDEVNAEIARHGPIDLFIDTSGATGVAASVTDEWTSWFRANQANVRRAHLLATSRFVHLMASMVKFFSRTGELIRIHAEPETFHQAFTREAPGFVPPPRAGAARPTDVRPRPDPAAGRREVLEDGSVRLSGSSCAFVYRRLRPGLLLVTITGDDKGELGSAPLDEMTAEIARHGALELFVDTSGATGAATEVSDLWTAWFRDSRPRLKRVTILATSKLLLLVVSIAKQLSGTGDLIRIHAEPELFAEALAREAPPAGG